MTNEEANAPHRQRRLRNAALSALAVLVCLAAFPLAANAEWSAAGSSCYGRAVSVGGGGSMQVSINVTQGFGIYGYGQTVYWRGVIQVFKDGRTARYRGDVMRYVVLSSASGVPTSDPNSVTIGGTAVDQWTMAQWRGSNGLSIAAGHYASGGVEVWNSRTQRWIYDSVPLTLTSGSAFAWSRYWCKVP